MSYLLLKRDFSKYGHIGLEIGIRQIYIARVHESRAPYVSVEYSIECLSSVPLSSKYCTALRRPFRVAHIAILLLYREAIEAGLTSLGQFNPTGQTFLSNGLQLVSYCL